MDPRVRQKTLRLIANGVFVLTARCGEVAGAAGGPRVVPEQRGPYDRAALVEGDHAVLLAADRHRRHVGEPAGRLHGPGQGGPPRVRVDLGALRVAGPSLADQRAGGSVAHHHLARLGRGVDAGDEWRARRGQRAPSTCSTASWSSAPKP
jgi:hypothetical protein